MQRCSELTVKYVSHVPCYIVSNVACSATEQSADPAFMLRNEQGMG